MFKYQKKIALAIVIIIIGALAVSLVGQGVQSQNSAEESSKFQPCSESSSRAIRNLIQNQLAQFRAQDVSGAYQYFSAQFQKDIDKERFSLIVGTNYPMLLEGTSASFGECRIITNGFAQALTTTSPKGENKLLYFISERDGPIKVEGITVEE